MKTSDLEDIRHAMNRLRAKASEGVTMPTSTVMNETAIVMDAIYRAEQAAPASAAEPAEPKDPLATWLNPHIYLEVSWGPVDGNEDDCQWLVHRRRGGRSDQEWILVAHAMSVELALNRARDAMDRGDDMKPRLTIDT